MKPELLLATVVAAAGSSVSIPAQADVPEAPGELVEVNGHLLHINCQGAGSPTVVFEAGMGGWSVDWEKVQPAIATSTRSCSYDRAGMGWSEPATAETISSRDIAEELHALLTEAGEDSPYLLVAHSIGGFHLQAFAHLFPEEVVGAVLVDASHEEQFLWSTDTYWNVPAPATVPAEQEFDLSLINWTGETAAVVRAMREDPKWNETTNQQEAQGTRDSVLFLREFDSLPNVPLIVLTAGAEKELEGYWTEDELAWNQAQRDLVALSPRSTQIHVPGASHYIHLDRPDVVIAAVLRVAEIARSLIRTETDSTP